MKKLAPAALLLSLILTGCTNDHAKLSAAGQKIGQARAHVAVPAWPDQCRAHEPHAVLALNQDALAALKRERAALDRQNARTDRCAGFYDDLAAKLK